MASAAPAQARLRAIVTGASSGIGRAAVALLAKQYSLQVLLVGRQEAALKEVAASVQAAGGVGVPCVCDVADAAAVSAAWDTFLAEVGPQPDFVLLNAGLNRGGTCAEISEADFDLVMSVVRHAAAASCVTYAAAVTILPARPAPHRTSKVCGLGCLT